MKEKLYRFMAGRYGSDTLNRHLIYVSLFIILTGFLTRHRIVVYLADVILLIVMLRMFSKNTYARYNENRKYLEMIKPVTKKINFTKRKLSDKEHRYFKCPGCKQIVRVPRGRGEIEITCPRCAARFTKKS